VACKEQRKSSTTPHRACSLFSFTLAYPRNNTPAKSFNSHIPIFPLLGKANFFLWAFNFLLL
jgi:hypothetical protein